MLRQWGVSTLAALASSATLSCSADRGIERPAPLFVESPIEYPIGLWDEDVEGETLLRVRVNVDGQVDSAVVMETSGHPEFDSAAVRGALELQFEPAQRRGEPLPVWAQVPVHFSKSPPPPEGR